MNTNTKQILIAIAAVGVMAVTVAMAQTPATPTAAAPAAAATATTAPATTGHKGRKKMSFEDRKAHYLQSLQKRAAVIQQQQLCVQAATDTDGLDKCKPPRHKRGGADTAAAAPAAPAAAPAAK